MMAAAHNTRVPLRSEREVGESRRVSARSQKHPTRPASDRVVCTVPVKPLLAGAEDRHRQA